MKYDLVIRGGDVIDPGSATHGPVFDMTTTMSKLLHFGVGLEDVVLRATATPAKILGLEGIVGTLRPGANADVAILELRDELRVPRLRRQYGDRQAPADHPPDAKGRPYFVRATGRIAVLHPDCAFAKQATRHLGRCRGSEIRLVPERLTFSSAIPREKMLAIARTSPRRS
jgi:hypothetical protein